MSNMNSNGVDENKDAKRLAWELFKESGNINYYSDLKDDN